MSTKKAILWNLDATDEEVISESIPNAYPVGEPESLLELDRRERVEASHYAPGGKYRSESWTPFLRWSHKANISHRCSKNSCEVQF